MIDLHTHIIPQVDDGSKSLEMSIKMLELEVQNGVEQVMFTPHFMYDSNSEEKKEKIKAQYHLLISNCPELPLKTYLGAEIMYNENLYQRIENGNEVFTLANSKYLLVEFPFHSPHYRIVDKLYMMVTKGYNVILAHPERYLYLTIDDINEIKSCGILVQINTSSLLKDFGKEVYKRAITMMQNGFVDFVASDCHDLSIRKPNLKQVQKLLKKYHISNKIDL